MNRKRFNVNRFNRDTFGMTSLQRMAARNLEQMYCGCAVLVLAFNLTVGAWSVNYLLDVLLGKTIPLIGAILIGGVVGEVSVPVALCVAILKAFGIL